MLARGFIVRIYFENVIIERLINAGTSTKALYEGKKWASYNYDESFGQMTKAVVIRESTNKVVRTEEGNTL